MTTESRIIPIESTDRNYNDNIDNSSDNSSDNINDSNDNPDSRKPSYVGLSCAVSGYSSFIRYTSPSRKNSPPQQFRVGTEPQVLNYNNMKNPPPVRGQQSIDTTDLSTYYPASHTRKIVTSGGMTSVETVTKFYNNNNLNGLPNNGMMRETSPGSDTSSVGSGGSLGSSNGASGGTTLVQKQIERLYGGKVSMVRLTSPEPKSDGESSSYSPESETVFSAHHKNGGSPLELKTLKVPAVFRLLRPEFREQLKNNSCQVRIPTDLSTVGNSNNLSTPTTSRYSNLLNKGERIIPIDVENTKNNGVNHHNRNNGASVNLNERIIPVVRDSKPFQGRNSDISPVQPVEKPALPAKPVSPTRTPRSHPMGTPTVTPTPKDITSPGLVQKVQKEVTPPSSPQTETPPTVTPRSRDGSNGSHDPENGSNEPETFPQPQDLDDEELIEEYPCAGVRERTLLCPIQEEDTESTASGCSVSIKARNVNNNNKENNNGQPAGGDAVQEEVHDGHYFIKILENEIFKFEEQICDFEEDLSNEANDFTEDVREHILAAIGKAKLLMSQKLTQFRGLCDKNINFTVEEDPFVPTSEDLAGFWDMVYIQVEHIHSLFAELTTIRQNGWKMPEKTKPVASTKKGPSKAGKSKTPTKANSAKPKSEAAKARDEARRKMLEERKRQMKLKQQQKQTEDSQNEVIFVEF